MENRRAIGQALTQVNQTTVQYFALFIKQEQLRPQVSLAKFVSFLNCLLLGYLMTQLTSEFHSLWESRDDFLDRFVEVSLHGIVSEPLSTLERTPVSLGDLPRLHTEVRITDLPDDLVRSILQQAKKQGAQPYAIAYLLFGAGLLPQEVIRLLRSHHYYTARHHLVQIDHGLVRQVPINQWIMGKRYGSTNNPLTQWLKSRRDDHSALFITGPGQPFSELELLALWQAITAGLLTPENTLPRIEQARQTWCVEMLMKGMNPEDLSILSGIPLDQLQPFVRRVKEKAALAHAIQLDQKSVY
jgi:hypothetical protein